MNNNVYNGYLPNSVNMQHYFNDGKKNRLRQRIRDFVKERYTRKRREQLRVLCLPGRELIELGQIWDPLGVRGSNISGAEIRKDYAEEIKKRNAERPKKGLEPISLYEGDIADLIASSHVPWDGMFLDPYSYFSRKWGGIVSNIARNRLIKPDGFLIINIFAGRENDQRQLDFLDKTQSSRALALAVTGKMEEKALAALAMRFSEYKKKRRELQKRMDFAKAREAAFTTHILETFFYLPATTTDAFYSPFLSKKTNELVELYERVDALAGGEFMETISQAGRNGSDSRSFVPHIAITLFRMLGVLFEKSDLGEYFPVIALKLFRPYILEDMKRHRYISKTKNLMISDFCSFKPIPQELLLHPYPLLISGDAETNGLMIKLGNNKTEIAYTRSLLEKYMEFAADAFRNLYGLAKKPPQRNSL